MDIDIGLFSKPARYLGIERNAVYKDEKVKVRFALCYPDIYEVGMSYYGYFLLYEIANSLEEVWCERCFAPWVDVEKHLRESKTPLFTLESKTPLFKMDIVGFSLTYELNMTNILNMMELGWIKVKAEDRKDGPIVIGGGPTMINPTPYEPFFDLIVIGEAEYVLVELLERFKELKGIQRERIIEELSTLDGVYSPFFPKKSVNRVYVKDLDNSFHAKRPPISLIGSIHDRLNVEISRGCGNGCRFCLAGFAYRPYRERSFDNLINILHDTLKATGYDEISLLSLSSGDHSRLTDLIRYIARNFPGVSISLPSLKIGTLKEEDISIIGSTARTGFTFALEAPSESLRRRINKNIDLESFHRQIPNLVKYGWRYLKVYLMIGFPWEKDEDFYDLLTFLDPLLKKGIRVQLSISPFVPKPHTPFQFLGVDTEENLKEKIRLIYAIVKRKNVEVKYRDVKQSFAEAIVSRGDKRIAELFLHLRKNNVRFEAWREFFDYKKYLEWFDSYGLEIDSYLKKRSFEDPLPWDFVDTGIKKSFLIEECRRAEYSIISSDCYKGCASCGLFCSKFDSQVEKKTQSEPVFTISDYKHPTKRIIIRYGKLGKAKYIGHLDTVRSVIRALRASGILFRMHGKYHPLPKISLSSAIPVGLESTCEYVIAEVYDLNYDFGALVRLANKFLPKGLKVFEIREATDSQDTEILILAIGSQKKGNEDFELLKERNGKSFYAFYGRNIKEILKNRIFDRLIKIRSEKANVLRASG